MMKQTASEETPLPFQAPQCARGPERQKSQKGLELFGNRWMALALYSLSTGTKRYGELRREIPGASQRMLTRTLRNLERDGLVRRKVYPVVPPMVEYSLTSLGGTLIQPLTALCQWSQKHMDEVEAHRALNADINGATP